MNKRVVFMGTPDFAVASLKELLESGTEVVAVVTAPDRKSGRGQKINESAVKRYAVERGIPVLQPTNLKEDAFLEELLSYEARLFVVVAFRMLPERVWNMPELGSINLHGSLLPNYRGAAPINWAVINGETKTGCTTFFIRQDIDTGDIIDQVEILISEKATAGEVHDELMAKGASLLASTVNSIFQNSYSRKDQLEGFNLDTLREAPKIFKNDCLIDWTEDTMSVYNKIRGLSPYPTAWCKLASAEQQKTMKLFRVDKEVDGKNHEGKLQLVDSALKFGCSDGWILPIEIQLEGKKRMDVKEVMNGFDFTKWSLV